MKLYRNLVQLCLVLLLANCSNPTNTKEAKTSLIKERKTARKSTKHDFFKQLADSAMMLTADHVVYDPTYFLMCYPNGDVPPDKGVCTDVIIRAYRKLNVDLQKAVHEDMKEHFNAYPHKWGLKTTDTNIDHRRVPNLMKFFERNKAQLPISTKATDYQYGDIVCWELDGGLTHIGIVVDRVSDYSKRNLIVHNIGGGQVLADCLFNYKIIGHYRFKPK